MDLEFFAANIEVDCLSAPDCVTHAQTVLCVPCLSYVRLDSLMYALTVLYSFNIGRIDLELVAADVEIGQVSER